MTENETGPEADQQETSEQQAERPVRVPNVGHNAKSGIDHQVIGGAAQEAYDSGTELDGPERVEDSSAVATSDEVKADEVPDSTDPLAEPTEDADGGDSGSDDGDSGDDGSTPTQPGSLPGDPGTGADAFTGSGAPQASTESTGADQGTATTEPGAPAESTETGGSAEGGADGQRGDTTPSLPTT